MTKSKTDLEKLKVVNKMILIVEKDWSSKKDKCIGYAPSCPNCMGQVFLGMLNEYKEDLEERIKK